MTVALPDSKVMPNSTYTVWGSDRTNKKEKRIKKRIGLFKIFGFDFGKVIDITKVPNCQ